MNTLKLQQLKEFKDRNVVILLVKLKYRNLEHYIIVGLNRITNWVHISKLPPQIEDKIVRFVILKTNNYATVEYTPRILSLKILRQEDHELKVCLNNITKSCHKKKKSQKTKTSKLN